MAYERNDYRGGRSSYGGDYGRDYGRDDYRGGRGGDGRGFFDRARDEVRGWFGDDNDRGRGGYDRDEYRGSYGRDEYRGDYGRQYGGGRDDEYRGKTDLYRGRDYEERGRGGQSYYGGGRDYDRSRDDNRGQGFFDRAREQVGEWFDDDDRGGGDYRRQDNRGGWRGAAAGIGAAAAGSYAGYRGNQPQGQQQRSFDHGYENWRTRQIEALDRDYDEYRQQHQQKFESDFHGWRQNRQTQRGYLDQVKEHAEVVGSDGEHVGTVDKVRGDRIILTKNDSDAGGHHHSIPSSWLQSADANKVTLSKTAEEAKRAWRDEESNQAFFGQNDRDRSYGQNYGQSGDQDQGAHMLNRSFSGTY